MTVAQRLIGLKRGVAFTPATVSGLVAWLDLSDAATLYTDAARSSLVASDADAVKGVTDKSGSGNHLEATGAATTYPLYKTAIQNSKSCLRFNGNDIIQTVGNITLSNDYTIFVVSSRTSTTGTQSLWNGDLGAGPRNFQTRYENAANTAGILPRPGTGTLTTVSCSAAATVDVLSFRVVSNTASTGAKAYANGAVGTAQTSPTTLTTARKYYVGSTNDGTGQFLTGDVFEVIHYNTALSATDHNLVGNYLQAKYATAAWTTVT